ncbi:hypothetical protein V8E55_006643 [Tylopilus felleus]
MGRPKLYNSAAERVLANRTYSKTYYEKQDINASEDHVVQGLADAPSPDTFIRQLKDVIHQVVALRTRGGDLQQEILQLEGVGGKFYRVQRVVRNLKDVIFTLEDVALLGEVDLEGTMQQH